VGWRRKRKRRMVVVVVVVRMRMRRVPRTRARTRTRIGVKVRMWTVLLLFSNPFWLLSFCLFVWLYCYIARGEEAIFDFVVVDTPARG